MGDGCSRNVLKRMHPNKDYNILLNKLISGTITDEERWQLDRASLDDPFLADAIEGIYDNEVDRKPKLLLGDTSKSRQIIWYKPLMVAASMIVLLGFSFLILQNINSDNIDVIVESSKSSLPIESDESNVDMVIEMESDQNVLVEETSVHMQSSKQKSTIKEVKDSSADIIELESVSNKNVTERTTQIISNEKKKEVNTQTKENRKEYVEEDVTIIKDSLMYLAEAAPPKPTEKYRSKVTTVPVLKQKIINGHVYDEGGMPISDALVMNESDTDSSLTDANGFFALELGEDDKSVSVRSSGFTPQSQAIRPELSITLQKSHDQFSQRPMLLIETMDAAELEIEYSNILDDGLRGPFSICPQERTTARRIRMRINISSEGRLMNLDYLTDLSYDCQRTIEEKIIQMSLEGAFKGNKAVVFYYNFRL